jgi:hypothetical protein
MSTWPTRFMRRLPSFCFSNNLRLRGDVTAIALGEHVFAHGGHGFAGDDPAADGGLNGNFEHLARDEFAEAGDEFAAAFIGSVAMGDHGESVDRFATDERRV